jgi:hypothetical protein
MERRSDQARRQTIEYKFLRQNTHHAIPKMRFSFIVYLSIFQLAFIILYAFFAKYKMTDGNGKDDQVSRMFPS